MLSQILIPQNQEFRRNELDKHLVALSQQVPIIESASLSGSPNLESCFHASAKSEKVSAVSAVTVKKKKRAFGCDSSDDDENDINAYL